MPSNYAHYLFGEQLLPNLPCELQKIIASDPQLYRIGQHGPDIIFYYRTFWPKSAAQIGFQMHKQSGRAFFEHARDVIQCTQDHRLISYTLGFLCHFLLDCNCHTYVYQALNHSRISHVEMETEFDRMLMLKQGKNPLTTNATAHIAATREHAKRIAQIFVPLTPEQIYEGIGSMKLVHRLLICPNASKRHTMRRLLRILHLEKSLGGFIVTPVANPLCQKSNQILYQLYQRTLEDAVPILTRYYSSIFTNAPLGSWCDHTFQGKVILPLQ